MTALGCDLSMAEQDQLCSHRNLENPGLVDRGRLPIQIRALLSSGKPVEIRCGRATVIGFSKPKARPLFDAKLDRDA